MGYEIAKSIILRRILDNEGFFLFFSFLFCGKMDWHSLALEVPGEGVQGEHSGVSIVEREGLKWRQWQARIDHAIVKLQHSKQLRIRQRLRKLPALDMDVDHRTRSAVVAHFHLELALPHLSLFNARCTPNASARLFFSCSICISTNFLPWECSRLVKCTTHFHKRL